MCLVYLLVKCQYLTVDFFLTIISKRCLYIIRISCLTRQVLLAQFILTKYLNCVEYDIVNVVTYVVLSLSVEDWKRLGIHTHTSTDGTMKHRDPGT